MLVKLTPGINFINVLGAAFTHANPKSKKKAEDLTVFLALLGSACVEALCKTLMKSTTGVNFINILGAPFCMTVLCAL